MNRLASSGYRCLDSIPSPLNCPKSGKSKPQPIKHSEQAAMARLLHLMQQAQPHLTRAEPPAHTRLIFPSANDTQKYQRYGTTIPHTSETSHGQCRPSRLRAAMPPSVVFTTPETSPKQSRVLQLNKCSRQVCPTMMLTGHLAALTKQCAWPTLVPHQV